MKVAIIYNKDLSGVINQFGMQNKETYDPKTAKRVAEALEAGGHNVAVIDGDMDVIENLQDFMPRVVEGERMGMVFNMAYGIQGESRYTHLPAMLEMLGIPYVGSGPTGHALALDKVITKVLMQKHGISTPDFGVFSRSDEDMDQVTYPVIVKPKMEAVSYGLKIVDNEDDLREAVKFVVEEFQQQALVEQFISGREFCVGLLGNNPPETFPVLEIDLEDDPDAIQTVDDKREKPREKICPAQVPDEIAKEMVRMSIAAFNSLQLSDFARVDIRMDQDNNIFLLEINSMASLGLTGAYFAASKVAGYDYKSLVNKMLDVAAVRYFAQSVILAEKGEQEPAQLKEKLSLPVRMRAFLRGRLENIENSVRKMVNTNTHVRNVEGVNDLGKFVNGLLNPLGFKLQVYSQVEVGNILFFDNTDTDKYDLLILGNLDNSITLSKHAYYSESEQRLYGSGIWSHKGGLAVMISALQALRFARVLRRLSIAILLTTDDALQGRLSKNIIRQKSLSAKHTIGLAGSSMKGTVVSSRSGAASYNCQMNLMRAEKAEDVARATNIFSKAMDDWTDLTDADSGLVVAGDVTIKSNITDLYAHGEASLSVRFNNPDQIEEIDRKIRNIVPKKQRERIHLQIEGGLRRPPMLRTEKVEQIWTMVKKLAERLDIRLFEEHRWSSAEICFVENYSPMLDGFGPIGAQPRGKEEFILRHSLLERAVLLAMTLYELGRKNRS
jgi:D-alanine-D-alanine ligase